MKLTAEIQTPVPMNFIIKEKTYTNARTKEQLPQYALYIYIDGKDTYDYLLDSLYLAKNCALKEFQVPLDAWTQVD